MCKAAVFCLVALHLTCGDTLRPYLENLKGSKLKLLNVSFKRARGSNNSSPRQSPGGKIIHKIIIQWDHCMILKEETSPLPPDFEKRAPQNPDYSFFIFFFKHKINTPRCSNIQNKVFYTFPSFLDPPPPKSVRSYET